MLVSCGLREQAPSAPTSFAVKAEKAQSLSGIRKDYTGVAESDKTSNLAFLVGGQVIKMLVSEGQEVKKGQLIAELDPIDIKLEVEAYKSQYNTTRSILDRNKRLLNKQAISQQDFEMAETQFVLAKAKYEGAMNKLSYTRLRAPFAGVIVRKMVDNFQTVNPGTPIVRLVQSSDLVVWFTVPDNNLGDLQGKTSFFVEFDAFKGQLFSAKIKEFIDSSPDGTGIPVSLVIDDPKFDNKKYFVKPGFSARVVMKIHRDEIPANYVAVPLTAIFKDLKSNEQSVWILNPDNTVTRKAVTVVKASDNSTIILSQGVADGQTVITAGVNKLSEGSTVTLLD